MTDEPTRGKRVQVYIPADLVKRWEATPRYERSAAVAMGLRMLWGSETTPEVTPDNIDSRIVRSEITDGDA